MTEWLVPFNLRLLEALRNARWKVKIRDKETREPPHVTSMRGTKAWRINLRTGAFMDTHPDPSEVPSGLIIRITEEDTWQRMCDAWDRLYPNNPVINEEHEE